jgi:ABC-2 type transport system ATP-binding protein
VTVSEIVVEGRALTKKFGHITAVDNLNIRINRGEIYGLIGPNSAGKTTTINMFLGIMKPTHGSITILGEERLRKGMLKRIGYMPQETALYEDLTVYETVLFFGDICGVRKPELRKRAHQVLEFVGLTEHKNTIVSNLSGGMKSRLSFVCSIIHQPQLLFLDEPTAGIDPQLRLSLWDYFREIAGNGATVLITTHYVDEASRCDRVGLMWKGKLIGEDSPQTLKSRTGKESLEDVFLTLSEELDL